MTVVNSVNPYRIEGQKTGAFEIVDVLGDAPDVHCIPVGNAGNITAYWKGYLEYQGGRAVDPPAPDARLPGRRRRSDRARATRSSTPRRWRRPSGSAIRPAGTARRPPRPSRAAAIAAVTDDEILEAYRFLATEESVFCEPASAASVAGLLKSGRARRLGRRTVVCVLTGHGLKDPDIAISQISVPTVVDADLAAVLAELSL